MSEVGGVKVKVIAELQEIMMVGGVDKTAASANYGDNITYGRKIISGCGGGFGRGWAAKHWHGHAYDYGNAPGPGPKRAPEITAVISSGGGYCDNDIPVLGAGMGGDIVKASTTTTSQQQLNSRILACITLRSSIESSRHHFVYTSTLQKLKLRLICRLDEFISTIIAVTRNIAAVGQ